MIKIAETKSVPTSSLKKGSYIIIDESACRVSDIQVSRPGKHGHAKYRIVGIGLIDEKKREIVTPAHEMDAPIIEKKNAQVLSINGDIANVMDAETYETFDLKIPEELKNDVKEGKEVLYWVILNEKIMKQVKNG